MCLPLYISDFVHKVPLQIHDHQQGSAEIGDLQLLAQAASNTQSDLVYAIDEYGNQVAIGLIIDGSLLNENGHVSNPNECSENYCESQISADFGCVAVNEECVTTEVLDKPIKLEEDVDQIMDRKKATVIKKYKVKDRKRKTLKELRRSRTKSVKRLQMRKKSRIIQVKKYTTGSKKFNKTSRRSKKMTDRTFSAPAYVRQMKYTGKYA